MELFIGFCVGMIVSCFYINIMDNIFKNPNFKIGDIVYWRHIEEVGATNSEWNIKLKKGTVISSDVRVCIEENNEDKTLIFLEKEKLYKDIIKFKKSIGAELTPNENFWDEASKIRL